MLPIDQENVSLPIMYQPQTQETTARFTAQRKGVENQSKVNAFLFINHLEQCNLNANLRLLFTHSEPATPDFITNMPILMFPLLSANLQNPAQHVTLKSHN